MATVLIALPGGEGIVRREDGEIMLTHDVTQDWGQPPQPHDRYQPIRIGLSDERMLFGGVLPPGAVSVEAVEAGEAPLRSFPARSLSVGTAAIKSRRARSCAPGSPIATMRIGRREKRGWLASARRRRFSAAAD